MSTIDDINYFSDARTQPQAGAPIITLEVIGDDGELYDEEHELPWRWAVCPVCQGKGSHVNPAIDCNGLTADDFAEDPDLRDDYCRGRYDQACNRCGGRSTVPEVDQKACTDEELTAWREWQRAEDDDFAAHLAELRAGA